MTSFRQAQREVDIHRTSTGRRQQFSIVAAVFYLHIVYRISSKLNNLVVIVPEHLNRSTVRPVLEIVSEIDGVR